MGNVVNPIHRTLRAILDVLEEKTNYKSREEFYTFVAIELSNIAERDIPWTPRLIYSALKENYQVPKEFVKAVEIFAAAMDGVPYIIAKGEFVKVFALGHLRENTQVPGDSRLCINEGCMNWFAPNVHNRYQCYTCYPVRGGK